MCLSGTYQGTYPAFAIPVRIPALEFDDDLAVVGVRFGPAGFDGIACLGFLERFVYGNFGTPGEFGLENRTPPAGVRDDGERRRRAAAPVDEVALIQRLNKALAKRINDEALGDPTSRYAGRFVGLANGQVAVVAEDWKTVHRRLEELDPTHQRCCWIEASRDYTIPVYV